MEICGDNRFEIIAKAKEHLLDATNIDTSEDEMKVLDSFLFRCWQMGWLDKYDRKTENSSEKPNNCERSVEYAKEMLDTMSCEECGHWEHGAGDHYYCALLEMRQECFFESKGESTLMFANKPKDEPTISKMEQVDKDINVRSKTEPQIYGNEHNCIMTLFGDCSYAETGCGSCEVVEKVRKALDKYEPKDEPQTDCDKCQHRYDGTAEYCRTCGASNFQPKDEPQTIKVGMATDSVTGKVLGVTLDTDCAWR